MPIISIIVPIYKVEKYIHKCIDSILNQSFKDFEVILVNDGSPDNCGAICDVYKKKDKRVKVIHKSNGGLSSARNAGLDIARGKYIAFVDSDDYIHEDMYDILYKNAINSDADIVICDYLMVDNDENTKSIAIDKSITKIKSFNNKQALNEIYSNNGVKFIVAWNKLYNRKLFDCLRYENGRIHEDEFIAHKVLYKAEKVAYIPIKLYYYLQRENSIMNSDFNIKKLDALYALDDRISFLKQYKFKELQEITEYYYVVMVFDYYDKFNFNIKDKEAIKNIKFNVRKNINSLLKNTKFNYREKILLIIFCTSSYLYKLYIDRKKRLEKGCI